MWLKDGSKPKRIQTREKANGKGYLCVKKNKRESGVPDKRERRVTLWDRDRISVSVWRMESSIPSGYGIHIFIMIHKFQNFTATSLSWYYQFVSVKKNRYLLRLTIKTIYIRVDRNFHTIKTLRKKKWCMIRRIRICYHYCKDNIL
jgi:hypothetical protein